MRKYLYEYASLHTSRSSGDVVVSSWFLEQKVRGSIPSLVATILETASSRDMAEKSLKAT